MKALLRKASKHVDDDGAVDVAILKRILAEDDHDPGNMREGIREREARLSAEMLRAADAERRLLEAQAKVNALILEKQQANGVAEKARDEANRIKFSLERVNRDIEFRNQELQRLENEFDELNEDFAKVRRENREMKLREAREAGRAEGRREGLNMGVREGTDAGYGKGYDKGYDKGYKELAERLMAELAKTEAEAAGVPVAPKPSNPQPFNTADAQAQALGFNPQPTQSVASHHRQESSGDTQTAPVTAAYRDGSRSHQRRPSRSDDESIQMPVPQHFVPEQQEREREPLRERARSPTRPPSTRASNHGGHRREQSGPTEAEQVKNAYRTPVSVHNAPSPRPHAVEVPLDDIYVPVLDKSGHIDVPPAHEWQRTTPTASLRDLPQARTPAQSPRLFAGGALPPNSSSSAPAPPSKTPKTTASSVRSRAYSGHDPRSRSPDHSTPLSQFSILHEEQQPPTVPPISIPMPSYARNRSTLSVIPEQSDADGTPTTRITSMSPSRQNHYNPSQHMPSVPYLAAAPDQGVRSNENSSLLDGRNVEMPVPERGVSFFFSNCD